MTYIETDFAWNTTDGPKQNNRELFLNALEEHIPNVEYANILMLPSKDAHDCKMIHEQYPTMKIFGVERDKKIHTHICQNHQFITMPAKPISFQDYVQERIDSNSRQLFHGAFLDFTSWPSDDYLWNSMNFINRMTRTDTPFVIGLTFCKHPRKDVDALERFVSDYTEPDMDKFDLGDDWNTAENVAWAYLNALNEGYSLRSNMIDCEVITPKTRNNTGRLKTSWVIEAIEYKAKKNSIPMYFILLGGEWILKPN